MRYLGGARMIQTQLITDALELVRSGARIVPSGSDSIPPQSRITVEKLALMPLVCQFRRRFARKRTVILLDRERSKPAESIQFDPLVFTLATASSRPIAIEGEVLPAASMACVRLTKPSLSVRPHKRIVDCTPSTVSVTCKRTNSEVSERRFHTYNSVYVCFYLDEILQTACGRLDVEISEAKLNDLLWIRADQSVVAVNVCTRAIEVESDWIIR